MSINLNGFWQSWDVVSGNTAASNEYEFWKGMVMSNGQVLNNQFDFFTYHNTTRYEWFKALQGTYPYVWDEYTFYANTNDPRIYDFYTFYKYGGEYLVGIPPSPTPTPTITPTNTPTPTPTPVGTIEFVAAAFSQVSYSYEGQDWYVGNITTGDSIRGTGGGSLSYNGSRWLAGCNGGSLIIYSDDSINWSGTNASSVFDVWVNAIIWDGSKWFAGGRSSNVFAESTDGINWSALTDASTYFSRIFQLVYDGTNIVAAGWDLSNTAQVASTNDGGNTWTDIVALGTGSGEIPTSLTYSSDLGLYVYTQQSGFDNVYISNDRVNWSAVTTPNVSSNSTYSCGWDGTKFVLGNQYNTNPLFYSYDGIDWSGSTNGGDYFYVVNDLHWDGNNWYAVGAGGDPGEPRMAYSTDGISWTGITNFPSFGQNFTSILAKNSPELIPPIPQPSPTPTPTSTPTNTPTVTPTPSVSPGPAIDADAAAYLSAVVTAGGTVDSTMSAATDTLFTSLKSNGLYSKLRVFYPMIGGTAASNAIMGNRASGSTYDISWTNVGNITFDYSGVTGNGSNTLGDTNFNVFTQISSAAGAPSHFSIYLGTDTDGSQGEIGVRGTSGDAILIAVDFGGTYYGWQYTQGGSAEFSFANSDARGMYVQSRTSNSSVKAFRNNVEKGHITLTESKSAPNGTIKLLSDGSIYSTRRFQFATIGDGLDDTEVTNLSNIINTFQTTLGRNVYTNPLPPSPTPTSTVTPTVTPTNTVTPTVTPTSTVTPTPTPSPLASTITYVGSYSYTANQSSYTENGINITSPGLVVLGGMGRSTTISSVTINGTNASIASSSGGDPSTWIAYLLVTGTSINVTVTYAGTAANAGLAVWRLNNLSSNTPGGTLESASSTSFAYTSLPTNSCIIAVGGRTGGISATWTNATENFDNYVESASLFTGASIRFAAGGNRTISASYGGGVFNPTGASAYWV